MKITDNHVLFFSKRDMLSNFYPFGFTHQNHNFETSEQAFMWRKAIFFDDMTVAYKILYARSPQEAKRLGRTVSNFDEELWDKVRFNIMKEVVHDKISQFPRLNDFIQEHKDKTFVEASPYDGIWGVKLNETNPKILNKDNWKGLNLLGDVFNELKHEI